MASKAIFTFLLLAGLSAATASHAQRGGPQATVNGAGFVPNGWCRGNGNPHAAQCPIFAPSTSGPPNHNSHQTPQTANQLPTVPQQPTLPLVQGLLITPQPPQVISGYSPGPQGTTAPTITGYSPGIVITPQPPQVISGYSPGPQGTTAPTITGYSPGIVITPQPPQTLTGYSPGGGPTQALTGQPVEIPRPKPTGEAKRQAGSSPSVTITTQSTGTSIGSELIAAKPGRQEPHAVPTFEAKATGDRWHCVASGHHVRKIFDDAGREVYAGSLPGIAIQVVPIIRDVPAWHDLTSECLVSVREHPIAKSQRR